MNIELFKYPSRTFRWRDRKGNFHIPAQMETRHLFMTLVLIWNHTMSDECGIDYSGTWKHHRYNLGPHYDMDYLCIAICSIANELFTRDNLESSWKATLHKMYLHLMERYKVRLLPCTVE